MTLQEIDARINDLENFIFGLQRSSNNLFPGGRIDPKYDAAQKEIAALQKQRTAGIHERRSEAAKQRWKKRRAAA